MAFLKNIKDDQRPDTELIALYKKTADKSAIGELYQRYMELVYGLCLKYLKQPEDAQDSVINIFEELLTKLSRHEVDNFKFWLYTLAKNHCLMRLRSGKKQVKVNFDIDLVQSEENVHLNGELDKEENFEKLDYCMAQLQEEQRMVIRLFYLENKSYNEVAEQTGMEWNKVRSLIQNGRRNLKICMDAPKPRSINENERIIKS